MRTPSPPSPFRTARSCASVNRGAITGRETATAGQPDMGSASWFPVSHTAQAEAVRPAKRIRIRARAEAGRWRRPDRIRSSATSTTMDTASIQAGKPERVTAPSRPKQASAKTVPPRAKVAARKAAHIRSHSRPDRGCRAA